MSGFPVPAKAIEAGREAVMRSTDVVPLGDEPFAGWTLVLAERVLEAALPVLAADLDLIERLGIEFYGRARRPGWPFWSDLAEPVKDAWNHDATNVLAALFGVASPPTKETEDA